MNKRSKDVDLQKILKATWDEKFQKELTGAELESGHDDSHHQIRY